MKRFLIFILLAGVFFSCKKETSSGFVVNNNLQINDTTWNNTNSFQSLAKEITEDIKLTELVDTVMVTNVGIDDDDKIFNNDNYRVTIPKYSLMNSITNRTFNKGAVKIVLQATTTKGNFIRNFCSSFINGRQAQSVGFFNLGIYYNDTLLTVKPGNSVHLLIKDSLLKPSPQTVTIYSGNGYDVTDDNFSWKVDSFSHQHLAYWNLQGSSVHNGYDVTLNKLGWISLSAVDNSIPANSKLNVYLPVNYTNKNTLVYAVQKDTKNVARLNSDYASRAFSLPNLPYGQNITLITVSKIDHKFYLGYSTVNYASNQTIFNVTPQQVTIANVIDYLNTL